MASVSTTNGGIVRLEAIADCLRARIVEGEYVPGSRMPSRVKLTKEFGASTATVQRALDRLAHEGFVRSRPRGGTFVVADPPHVNTYALAFTTPPTRDGVWQASRFWTVLCQEALGMQGQDGPDISMYMGVNEDEPSDEYERLRADVQARRVAGVIATVPWPLLRLMRESPVPCVSLYDKDDLPGVLPVCLDQRQWLERALEYLAGRDRHRVAVITPSNGTREKRDEIAAAVKARGLTTRLCWIQGVDVHYPYWAGPCARLLAQGVPSERADALLICDDTLADHAAAGLAGAGVRVPDDVEVVCHCNFPDHAPSVLAVRRLGFDVPQVLRTCIEVIDRKVAGEPVAGITRVPVLFEEELAAQAVGAPRRP